MRIPPFPAAAGGTLALALALAFAVAGEARASVPTEATLNAAAQALVAAGSPGAIVRADTPRVSVRSAAGVASRDPRRRAQAGDSFRVGSVTKTFTATVVLQLAQEGKVALDAPLATYLPGSVPGADAITVRQLLNQTSGLADYAADPRLVGVIGNNPAFRWTPAALLAIAATLPGGSAPGSTFRYSNTNYLLAGLLVEKVTGHSIATEIRSRILKPLRLRDTTYATAPKLPKVALHGHLQAEGKLFDTSTYSPTYTAAAGSIVSTPGDVADFYRGLLAGKLLRRSALAQMRTTTAPSRQAGVPYGLGLFRVKTSCGSAWGHDGEIFGTQTLAFAKRDGSRAAVVVVNRGPLTKALETARVAALDAAYCGSSR